MGEITFGRVTPVLRVGDLASSLDYYRDVLGFHTDWQDGNFASVTRGKCNLFLSEGDQGNAGSWVWIAVSDAVAIFEELKDKGAKIRQPPANYPWGSCEAQLEDPDGNVLRLGSDPVEGLPDGDWLDMHGTPWVRAEGRGWRLLK